MASPRQGSCERRRHGFLPPALLLSVAVGCGLASVLNGCGRSADKSADDAATPAVVAATAVAEARTLTRFIEVPGTVRPVDRASVASRVLGVIEFLPVGLGQTVKRGEVLARIGAKDIAARVAQAEAHLAEIVGDLKRERQLFATGAGTAENVRTLEARQRAAEAALDEARTILGYTTIVAPFDGTITRRPANVGDLALPGTPILEMEGLTHLRVEAELPESLARLTPGTALEISAAGETSVTGTLAEISPSADNETRTALAKIDLPADAPVRSGQFVRVAVPAREERVVLVPAAAISTFGQMERVFVIENDRLRLRLVRTASRRGAEIEVVSGLRGSEVVVLEPSANLHDGQAVAKRP